MYFIGGIFGKNIQGNIFDSLTIGTAKVDSKVHELLETKGIKEIYDMLQKLEETGKFDIIGNSWDKILDFYVNYDDVVKYYSQTALSQIWGDNKDYFSAWKKLLSETREFYKSYIATTPSPLILTETAR